MKAENARNCSDYCCTLADPTRNSMDQSVALCFCSQHLKLKEWLACSRRAMALSDKESLWIGWGRVCQIWEFRKTRYRQRALSFG